MDSKELIKLCNAAGVNVKSSALASISPEERDIVLNFIKEQGVESGQGESVPEKELAPTREPVSSQTGKVRQLKSAGPLASRMKSHSGQDEESDRSDEVSDESGQTNSSESETDSSDETAKINGTASGSETETADQEMSETSTAVSAEDESAAVEVSGEDETETTEPMAGEQEGATTETSDETESEKGDEGAQSADEVKSISREDYVPSSGSAMNRIREMRPRGNLRDPDSVKSKPKPVKKSRPKPAIPTMAAPPKFAPKVPEAKKDEPAAQKPDMPLSAAMLNSKSPLADHLKKSNEDRKTRRGGGTSDDETEGKRRPGLGLQETRDQRRSARKRQRHTDDDGDVEQRTSARRKRSTRRSRPVEHKTDAEIEFPITVRSLSEAMGRPAKELLKVLFANGKMATINEQLDEEEATELAMELGVDLKIKREQDLEEVLEERLNQEFSDDELVTRAPIITILGHVDHGKTTLVDTLRSSNVVSGEAGGITQHIAAYQVIHDDKKLTFVDTPGHAAFGEMRARGANVTDIVVLVVAADDGVMPQTVECISHAKAAEVPIVVAMNKIDLPDINEQKVLQDLAGRDLLPAEWGGDIEVVRTSALERIGIDELLETLILTAELHEYRTSDSAPAHGVCLEAFRDEGRGPIAWFIVQTGTLRIGDVVVCDNTYGRIRAMYDDKGNEVVEAGPSTPIKVAGLESVPGAGEHFFVMPDIEQARNIAELRLEKGRNQQLSRSGSRDIISILTGPSAAGQVKDLPMILKGDTPGSLEALRGEIEKFDHPEVRVNILHDGVGGVNESDVYLASASGAVIIAFNVIAEDRATIVAEKEGVEIRRYDIIYELTDDIRNALEGMLAPEKVEVATGRALVLQTFDVSRFGRIAGCRVLNGTIERNNHLHVIRDQKILNSYPIASLRREKDDVKEVREGMECGIRLDGFNDVKEGDLLEAFRIDEIKRSLDD